MTRSLPFVRILGAATVAGVVAALAVPFAAHASTPTVVEVRASQIADSRPATGGWYADTNGSQGTFAVTRNGPHDEVAMRLGLESTSDKVYLHNTFGSGSRPDDIPALLEGASYDYAGTNVNFQIEIIFEPADVALYGPAGSARACTPASTWYGWGLTAETDWCYTILKWEPYVRPGVDDWTHVDLSVDTAAHSASSTGGWVSSKNLGNYPGNVSVGQLMSTYLGAIADYEVTAFAFGIGSGTPGPAAGFVPEYTIGGITYRFVTESETPAGAPAADSEALDRLVTQQGIDVDADTDSFRAGGGTSLDALDPSAPFDGRYENWSDPGDAYVDVFTYSTATYVGTFPVVGRTVVLSRVDLSHLDPGAHRLVIRGQKSGKLAVVRFGVSGLAATGPDDGRPLMMLGGGLMLAGLVTVVLARRGRPTRSRGRHAGVASPRSVT